MRCHPERNWRGMNSPSAEVEEVDDLVSAAVEGLLMLARGGEDVNEEKDEYVDGDSIGDELSDVSACEDELEKKMMSCSDKKAVTAKRRKLETLETANDSKLYRSLGEHKKYKSNRGDEEEEGGDEEKEHVKSEKEKVGKLEEAMLGLHRCEVCYKNLPKWASAG